MAPERTQADLASLRYIVDVELELAHRRVALGGTLQEENS
jgi:hypothetical protein